MTRFTSSLLAFALFHMALLVPNAVGQNRVINVPSDSAPREIRSGTQLNLFDEGVLRSFFEAFSGSELNIMGGSVGYGFESAGIVNMTGGSIGNSAEVLRGTVNISGGVVGSRFEALRGQVNLTGGSIGRDFMSFGEVNISGGSVGSSYEAAGLVSISGGSIGSNFSNHRGSQVEVTGGTFGSGFNYAAEYDRDAGGVTQFFGGEFLLNGAPWAGTTVDLEETDIFTGTLVDGSTFLFTPQVSDNLSLAEFVPTAIPALDATPTFVNQPRTIAGLRPGQTLTLVEGGTIPDDSAIVGATLHIAGGSVGDRLEVTNSTINLSTGVIGEFMVAHSGTIVEMTGGKLENGLRAFPQSEINIRGGTLGNRILIDEQAAFNLYGGEFLLNGVAPTSTNFSLGNGSDVLTGTLADGTAVVFSPAGGDRILNVNLFEAQLPAQDLTPRFLNDDQGPRGLRAGERLTVNEGGLLDDNFTAVGATLNITGGAVGKQLEVVDSLVNISGGSVGDEFSVYDGSVVNVRGGLVGNDVKAERGSVFNISDGVVGYRFTAARDSVVNMSGGEIGYFTAAGGSVVNISGGKFVGTLNSLSESVINITGGEFADGVRSNPGGIITIDGGTFASEFQVGRGSVANISAGEFNERLYADRQGLVNISGGQFPNGLAMSWNSELHLSGGAIGPGLHVAPNAAVTLIGGDFQLNGVSVEGKLAEIEATDILTGTLADGSVYLFSPLAGDFNFFRLGGIIDFNFVESPSLPEADLTPMVVNDDQGPAGLRAGQTLTLVEGGTLRHNFTAVGATLNIAGGVVGGPLEVFETQVNISDGIIDGSISTFHDSEIHLTRGHVEGLIDANAGSTIIVAGGTILAGLSPRGNPNLNLVALQANSGSEIQVSAGLIEGRVTAEADSMVSISGGQIRGEVNALRESWVEISGGLFDTRVFAGDGSSLVVTGGTFNGLVELFGESKATIRGGQFAGGLHANAASEVNLIGREFLIDGVPVDGLTFGSEFLYSEREGTLSGVFLDNTPFSFTLRQNRRGSNGHFDDNAVLTLTLVPEPNAALLVLTSVLLTTLGRMRTRNPGVY